MISALPRHGKVLIAVFLGDSASQVVSCAARIQLVRGLRKSAAVVKLCCARLRVSLYYGTASPMASPSSSTGRPVYLKLRDQIAAAILDGTFAEGAMLPSVRAYAAAEAANPLTVAKAYQQFQDEGLVQVQRGVGMFVAPGAAEALRAREREAFLRHEWPEIRARMRRLHLDAAQLLVEPEHT